MLAASLRNACGLDAVLRLRFATSVARLGLERSCILGRDTGISYTITTDRRAPFTSDLHGQTKQGKNGSFMHREWGQKLPVEGSQAEQAATAQGDHSGPGAVPCCKMVAGRACCNANCQFLLWWLSTGPCPIFPLRYFRYFPWLLVPADLPDTGPVPVPSLNKEPVFQHLAQKEV